MFKRDFHSKAESLGTQLRDAMATHLSAVQQVLDMLRDENVALESERDSNFRRRVESAVADSQDVLSRLQEVL